MNKTLIDNWNSVVRTCDNIYFLGDFLFGGDDKILYLLRRLNGRIHFIEGDHDKISKPIRSKFVWYDKTRLIKVEGQKIFLSHYAHRTWRSSCKGSFMLFGHSHNRLTDDPTLLSCDVGVDCWNYFPVSFAQIKEKMAQKQCKIH